MLPVSCKTIGAGYSHKTARGNTYIVGCQEQAADLAGEADFDLSEFPIPNVRGPLSYWAVRSQLADNKPNQYLNDARKQLERAGVPHEDIDRSLASGMDDWSGWKWRSDVTEEERTTLLSNFFQALRLRFSSQLPIYLDGQEIQDSDIAREKMCLGQIAKKYEQIVDRWEQLKVLPFDDPQLHDASNSFLHGFYRARVIPVRTRS